jgi:putative heme-binding domain-containing protein
MRILVALALGGAWVAQQGAVPAKNPFAGDAGAVESGRVMFRMYCAGCHGLRATGGRSGPDLTRGGFGDADADVFHLISDGVPGTEMPAFGARLEDDERWRLVSYVRSLVARDPAPVPGDRAAGEQLFWGKGGCGRCHRVGGRGSGIGPDLTRAGRQRSLAYLRESILTPDADITPSYATITVVMRDGRRISGVEKGFDNFSARLMDLNGRYYSVQRDEVASVEREYRSLMPGDYRRLFTDRELEDLIAYLANLGAPTR